MKFYTDAQKYNRFMKFWIFYIYEELQFHSQFVKMNN